jgi:hypothetical protein
MVRILDENAYASVNLCNPWLKLLHEDGNAAVNDRGYRSPLSYINILYGTAANVMKPAAQEVQSRRGNQCSVRCAQGG